MRTIRVETSATTILLTEAPEPKVRDRQTGEIAKDAVSGEALMTIGVVHTKSRRYSTTLGVLRDARAEWRRAQAAPPTREPETTYVLAHWVFAGTGLSATEAWLAASTANTRPDDAAFADSKGGHLDGSQD